MIRTRFARIAMILILLVPVAGFCADDDVTWIADRTFFCKCGGNPRIASKIRCLPAGSAMTMVSASGPFRGRRSSGGSSSMDRKTISRKRMELIKVRASKLNPADSFLQGMGVN